MIILLDHWIFGNGFGLASPNFDERFYWLSGQFYTFSHAFGAQLRSFQWTHPRAGERRILSGYEFQVFNSHRRGCRVEVLWALVDFPRDVDSANKKLREIGEKLGKL